MILLKNLLKSTFVFLAITTFGCATATSQETKKATPVTQEWKDYWYSGKAELTRYKLEQVRYGESHEGDAVMIFVTEDFLEDKQVKYERGSKERVKSVLKLNNTKRFWTGIYPYSLITSSFSPVDGQSTIKVSTSAQEWCGHSYSQINFRNGKYEGLLHSYFQNEGDKEFELESALLEDEIWAQVRMRPGDLPKGEIKIIPGMQFQRLKHREFQVESAKATISTLEDAALSTQALTQYSIDYNNINRVLTITYETAFPHTIVAWEEQETARDGQIMTTRATRTHSVKSPYWGQNSLADSVMRQKLGFK
ncbi:MAG: hypothetical protein HEP71_22410 [Roseivirga sp.]|nr:hypothetical protein [Roseivirga sp.]